MHDIAGAEIAPPPYLQDGRQVISLVERQPRACRQLNALGLREDSEAQQFLHSEVMRSVNRRFSERSPTHSHEIQRHMM